MYVAAVGREYLDSERQPNCMPELLFRRHIRICKCVLLCYSCGEAPAWKMHRIVNNYFYLTKEEYVRHLLMSIGYSHLCLDITQFPKMYREWDSAHYCTNFDFPILQTHFQAIDEQNDFFHVLLKSVFHAQQSQFEKVILERKFPKLYQNFS